MNVIIAAGHQPAPGGEQFACCTRLGLGLPAVAPGCSTMQGALERLESLWNRG